MNKNGGDEAQEGVKMVPTDDRLLVKWLESQEDHVKISVAQAKFNELLLNAAQPRHATVNACIKLCYYVEQCMGSRSISIRDIAFASGNCVDLFNFYIDWNEKNQSRSMRQVLELVSSLVTKNPDLTVASAVKSSLLERILSILAYEGAQALVKPAFKSLEYLMSKRTISTETFIEAYRNQRCLALESSSLWDAFLLEVFDWMALADVAPAAGKFLVTVFRQMRKDPREKTSPADTLSWQRWIRAGLSKDPQAIENVKNYIFLPLFKLDRLSSLAFLGELNKQGPVAENIQELDTHSLLQLAAIEVGKKAGLIEEPIKFKQATKKTQSVVALKEDAISVLLSNSSDMVRSLAFSVMVSSSSPIRPFSAFALNTLQCNLSTLYSDTDAKFRNEVLSNSKHMIDRLRGATAFLVRELDSIRSKVVPDETQSSAHAQLALDIGNLLQAHKGFVEWYFNFLLGEFIPTISYQRHITALKAIELLLRSGILHRNVSSPIVQKGDNDTVWPFHFKFFTPSSIRLLLDFLMDPFEDVRSGATAILKLASPEDFKVSSLKSGKAILPGIAIQESGMNGRYSPEKALPLELLHTFIRRAESNSRMTGRADYADGVARSYELLYSLQKSAGDRFEILEMLVNELESKIVIAESDLGRAVLEAPVHGQFAGLSLVWDSIDYSRDFGSEVGGEKGLGNQLELLQQRAVGQCSRIWAAVKDILCNDSPEGHLPQELDETEAVDTKDVLSYSFRAVHESSNLMRMMVNKLTSRSREELSIVSQKVFAQVGDLTFEQLSSLRHRGAFATVSLTFARCCVLTQLQGIAIAELLSKWYQGALECIFEQVSTTRRSAGIPALLTGIMVANSKEPAFEDIVSKLKSIARQPAHQMATDETNLPQVHAMNSLKETFKSSTLGRRAENHIGDCLQIAVDSLKSEIWAIRNCGLLLLRSLIDCLFGTSDSKMAIEAGWDGKSIKISYDKYPTLPELLIKLLSKEVDPSTQVKSEISTVESVFPALDIVRRAGPPSTHRDEIYKLVAGHLGSRVWNVREMAAHAMSVLVPQSIWAEAIKDLLESQKVSTNLRHGSLMAVRFILERQRAMDVASALGGVSEIVPALYSSFLQDSTSHCPEIITAHIEARNAVGILLTSASRIVDSTSPQHDQSHLPLFDSDPSVDFLRLIDHNSNYTTWHPTCIALARRAICSLVLRRDYAQLADVFHHAIHIGTDVALAALNYIPGSKLSKLPGALLAICEAYISTIITSNSSEVRAAALEELFDALAPRHRNLNASLDTIFIALMQLVESQAAPKRESPAVQNAELQMSGWLLLASIYLDQGNAAQVTEHVKSWTRALSLAGKKTEDFDTRMAAVLALDSIYVNVPRLGELPADLLFPCHMAMYDSLNDDDSDIREIAAKTYSTWASQSFMPLAAQKDLANTLMKDHASHPLLLWNVVSRLTRSLDLVLEESFILESPFDMFKTAMNVDNTLFVEEDQNLYIDEVREVKYWKDVFERLYLQDTKEGGKAAMAQQPLFDFLTWAVDAVNALTAIEQQDGVLGWSSKPAAFSACLRTILCAKSLLDYDSQKGQDMKSLYWEEGIQSIRTGLDTMTARAVEISLHESLIAELVDGSTKIALKLYGLQETELIGILIPT